MIKFLLKGLCDHNQEDLAIKTITYNKENVTCSAIDRQIICTKCGSVIVDRMQYYSIKSLMSGGE